MKEHEWRPEAISVLEENFIFSWEKERLNIIIKQVSFSPDFIKQAPKPSSCVRASLMTTIYIPFARKMLVKSNFRLCLC